MPCPPLRHQRVVLSEQIALEFDECASLPRQLSDASSVLEAPRPGAPWCLSCAPTTSTRASQDLEQRASEFGVAGEDQRLGANEHLGGKFNEHTEEESAVTRSPADSHAALREALMKLDDEGRRHSAAAAQKFVGSIQRQMQDHLQRFERQRAHQHERTLKLLGLPDDEPSSSHDHEHDEEHGGHDDDDRGRAELPAAPQLQQPAAKAAKTLQVTFDDAASCDSYPMIFRSEASGLVAVPMKSLGSASSNSHGRSADGTSLGHSERSRTQGRRPSAGKENLFGATFMNRFLSEAGRNEDKRATTTASFEYMKALQSKRSRTWGSSWSAFSERRYRPRVSCLEPLRRLVDGKPFKIVVVCLIILNALIVAWTEDASLRVAMGAVGPHHLATGSPTEQMLNIFFVAVFTVELLLRLVAKELSFFIGPEWNWNLLDSFIVVTSIMDILMTTSGKSWLRLLRCVRVVRTMRIVRVLRFFRQLRMILVSVCGSIVPLFWAFVFLLLMMFAFSMVAIQGVTDYLRREDLEEKTAAQMRMWFDSLPMAILSHFLAISGGWSWWDMAQPLFSADWGYGCIFIFYIVVMVVMVLNIITGIFVNDAIEIAHSDREFAADAEMEKAITTFDELLRLFEELDTTGSGSLSLEEFEEHAAKPQIRVVFATLGLDISDPVQFFRLLDVEGVGSIEIAEFVVGCLNLKGGAKAVTMENILLENKRLMKHMMNMHRKLEARIESLSCSRDLVLSQSSGLSSSLAVDEESDVSRYCRGG